MWKRLNSPQLHQGLCRKLKWKVMRKKTTRRSSISGILDIKLSDSAFSAMKHRLSDDDDDQENEVPTVKTNPPTKVTKPTKPSSSTGSSFKQLLENVRSSVYPRSSVHFSPFRSKWTNWNNYSNHRKKIRHYEWKKFVIGSSNKWKMRRRARMIRFFPKKTIQVDNEKKIRSRSFRRASISFRLSAERIARRTERLFRRDFWYNKVEIGGHCTLSK